MPTQNSLENTYRKQLGLTLIELMVALAIGSFLVIGSIQIYSQSREAFIINESIARVQETAQFAMDTIEADLRMASNWGRTSRGLAIENRSIDGNANPKPLVNVPADCGASWVLDLAMPVDGANNTFNLPCAALGGAQAFSDLITVRRATVNPQPLQAGRLQIQSTRIAGEIFDDGVIPTLFSPADSATHNLMVSSYYVAANSDLIPGVPTLRRKSLVVNAGVSSIVDVEIAPGVENLQVQLGIDVDEDNTVDRYVNPGDDIYNPAAAGYVPGARVITARVWIVVRGVTRENGIIDTYTYQPGDVNLGTFSDDLRRMQVSKTILLRNTRT
ncbi:MAG: PilW family protein [Proteobacteria bacterium]|nr:PilW family protein [Pseudomonadota bacterium]